MPGLTVIATEPVMPVVLAWSQFCPVVVVVDALFTVTGEPLYVTATFCVVVADPTARFSVRGLGVTARPCEPPP